MEEPIASPEKGHIGREDGIAKQLWTAVFCVGRAPTLAFSLIMTSLAAEELNGYLKEATSRDSGFLNDFEKQLKTVGTVLCLCILHIFTAC